MSDDFSRLYAHLGLREDCSLDEFKRACRRRIHDQHPDRLHVDRRHHPGEPQIPLVELLPLYAKALHFHRRHGRLPGAPVPAHGAAPLHAQPSPPATHEAVTPFASRLPSPRPDPPAEPPARSLRGPLLASFGVVAALALVGSWNEHREPPRAAADTETSSPDAGTAPLGAVPMRLEIGMDEQTVRAIQGKPLQWNGAEWIYGPSWLRFEDGYLVDWYSSPLHPLATRTRTPPQD